MTEKMNSTEEEAQKWFEAFILMKGFIKVLKIEKV